MYATPEEQDAKRFKNMFEDKSKKAVKGSVKNKASFLTVSDIPGADRKVTQSNSHFSI
jgi:hypothetical protein